MVVVYQHVGGWLFLISPRPSALTIAILSSARGDHAPRGLCSRRDRATPYVKGDSSHGQLKVFTGQSLVSVALRVWHTLPVPHIF